MLNAIRRGIGLSLSRWRFRKAEGSQTSFTRFFSEAHTVLIVLPLWVEDAASPHQLLHTLTEHIKEENLTIVTGTQETYLAHLVPRSKIVRIHENELTTFHLPRPAVMSAITERKYDIAIDLNLDFLLPSAYICRDSNARIRVGFARKDADAFFNMQIERNPGLDKKSQYDRLAEYLKMF
jgi:ADP-heptose:LPS heptosyltransferase